MKKIFFIGVLFIVLISPSLAHSIYIKNKNDLVSSDTTVLDDWQSVQNIGVFFVEEIMTSPEYETQFTSDIYDIFNMNNEYWLYDILYKSEETHKIKLKLLKLKVLKWWKGPPPQTEYIYSISYNVSHHLKPGDRAIIAIHKWLDTSNSSHIEIMGYNIKNFEKNIGHSFLYAYMETHIPIFRIEDNDKEDIVFGCIDGLAKKPFHNIPLKKLEEQLLTVINEEPQTNFAGIFPSKVSARNVKKCRKVPFSEKVLETGLWIIRKLID